MNDFFCEIPTAMPRSPAVEALDHRRIAVAFATGEMRAAELELCEMPNSSEVAVSARLDTVGSNPRDGLIQYLTPAAVERIHADLHALPLGAHYTLDLSN